MYQPNPSLSTKVRDTHRNKSLWLEQALLLGPHKTFPSLAAFLI